MRKTNEPGYFIEDDRPNVVINRNDGDLKSYRNQISAEKRVKSMERQLEQIMRSLVEIKEAAKGA